MDKAFEQNTLNLDPIWVEKAGDISLCGEAIHCPQTKVGEDIYKDSLQNTVFLTYNRLPSIFGSLIALVEYDEIFKDSGVDYFSVLENQRVVIRALGLIAEDSIKLPYDDSEKKDYFDHKPFFEGYLKRLRELDRNIEEQRPPINFVSSLLIIFQQEVNKLKGVENFRVKIGETREKIKDYLPTLAKVENGQVLGKIRKSLSS